MRTATTVKAAMSVAELTALNRLMRGTGTVETFERELVTRVYAGARGWLDELEGHELTRDQRRRWNAAVRHVNRYVSRGGVPMAWRVLTSLNQSRDLLEDPHVLKTAVVAAAAHGPLAPAPRAAAETTARASSAASGARLVHTGA
ncbi:hypothetical protein [Kocuria rhizophila]|uniref:hypothetical protein n=1 Tax=Kocuria rhizophila TaxID=72000 RepID=UPI00057F2AAB|nr:hypothetical protein [Kocuria rhizophila]KIC66260.1 hypothetical protein RK09_10715 [Kocuria rhizophila]MBO4145914.1 hypothetical protein [Kocuria rhizophila]